MTIWCPVSLRMQPFLNTLCVFPCRYRWKTIQFKSQSSIRKSFYNLVRIKDCFNRPCVSMSVVNIPEWAWFSQQGWKKDKKHVTLTRQFTLTSFSTIHLHFIQSNPKILTILKSFSDNLIHRNETYQTPKVGEKSRSESQDCDDTFKPKNYL